MSPELRSAIAALVVAVLNQLVGELRARQARRVRDDIEAQRAALSSIHAADAATPGGTDDSHPVDPR